MTTGTFVVLEHAAGLAAAVYVEKRGYFGMLSVLPGLQGRGLGKRMVRIAEALCEATGCEAITLRIINLREELGRWYRSLGYTEVAVAPYTHRPVKQPCHFIEMRRSLGPTVPLAA
jgi:ribosomal protein S18 acetylase RimI-like enzyme